MGSKVFIILTRKLTVKTFKLHFNQLFLLFFNQIQSQFQHSHNINNDSDTTTAWSNNNSNSSSSSSNNTNSNNDSNTAIINIYPYGSNVQIFNIFENGVGEIETKKSYNSFRHNHTFLDTSSTTTTTTTTSVTATNTATSAAIGTDINNAIDGLSRLLFYTCKGVKGCLHSLAGEKISVILTYGLIALHKTSTSTSQNK